MKNWWEDAVFYEIYPQSFYDTNGDGIGDINGITQKLDYIRSLGCDAIWINPCFDSPFKDAGYDVRDYKKVAPRYGTNDDLQRCFEQAHKRGMHIILDLVPGHTSEEHPWFLESQKQASNEYSNRYIWTSDCFEPANGFPYIGGESERSGTYLLNFFKCQPALNYGFYQPKEPWQLPIDHPDCLATREAIKDVMRFWLSKGCDGFRVDLAMSLVKNDDEMKHGTREVWADILGEIKKEYPECAVVSEWNRPECALKCGFDMDFYLNEDDNGMFSLLRAYDGCRHCQPSRTDHSYFKQDSGSSISAFLKEYLPRYEATKHDGSICMPTCNHDTLRLTASLTLNEIRLVYAFLFTMPGVPFLYYGDEIAMRYLKLPTKEGGYFRTGSRTPMQWTDGINKGFSEAKENQLYLPVDDSQGAPSVEQQERDPDSMLNFVRGLTGLRHRLSDLRQNDNFSVVCGEQSGRLFVYRRGSLLCAVHPGSEPEAFSFDGALGEPEYFIGEYSKTQDGILMRPQSFGVWKI